MEGAAGLFVGDQTSTDSHGPNGIPGKLEGEPDMEGLSSIDDHRSLIDLNGKTILLPEQKQYAPKHDALLWRENRLRAG
jgi:hypothetical protein